MSREECVRCKAVTYTTDGPHLCKDVAARLKRREAQKAAVVDILIDNRFELADGLWFDTAEEIVEKLANMGVQND